MSLPLYLLDTNTASYAIKPGYPGLRAKLGGMLPSQLAISTITEAELRFWIANRPQATNVRILVDAFLSQTRSMPWDSSVTIAYAKLRIDCKHSGKALAELDMLIAAHAIALQATLVTHDKAFSQIADLRTEDWV
jgi:tRNA(fMet)-specific endonuclease VapC